MPIQFVDPTLQSNESFKTYETLDDLGKAYLDLNAKVTGGSIDLLPEDMRKDPAISRYKNLPELAKGLVETQKMVGSIEKAPEKPDLYKMSPVTGLHANVKAEGIGKTLLPIFHGAGLGNKQADMVHQGLMTTLSGLMVQQEKAKKDALLASETELRTAWGADYEAKFDRIVKTMQMVGGADMATQTDAISAAMKGSPKFLKAMGKIIGLLSEDSLKSLGEGQETVITDAKAAQAEIDKYTKEISSSGKKHAYWNDKDPGHEQALKKMHDLHALLVAK